MTLREVCLKKCPSWSIILRTVMIVSLILALWRRDFVWVIGTFIGIFISFLPTILKKDIKFTLPWTFDFFIALISILHIGGRLLDYYYTIPGYTLFTRFFISIFVAFLGFTMIYILDEYWDGLKMDKYAMAFVAVVFTMFVGVILEFTKWFNLSGYYFVGATTETAKNNVLMLNLSADIVAGIIIAFIGVLLIKRGRFDEVTGDFGKQIDEMVIDRIEGKK